MAKTKNPTSVTPRYVCGPGDNQVVLLLGDILGSPAQGVSGTPLPDPPLRTTWTTVEARELAKALNRACAAIEGTEDADE